MTAPLKRRRQTFACTGGQQTFTVPNRVKYLVVEASGPSSDALGGPRDEGIGGRGGTGGISMLRGGASTNDADGAVVLPWR